MFAVQFSRFFWKEYRTQRTLWVICFLIGTLSAVINLYFVHYSQRTNGMRVLVASPAIFAAIYAVGCGALLFANEREHRTSDWLLSLSILPNAALRAKFAFAIVATIALQLALVVVSLLLSTGVHFSDLYISELPQALPPFGLLVLIWAAFGSLMSRRVLASIGAMVLGVAVSVWLPIVIFHVSLRIWFDTPDPMIDQLTYFVLVLSVIIVLCADVWLGRRWCQGKYLDGSIIEDFGAACERFWNERTSGVLQRCRIPVRVDSDEPWRRSWQRLTWQERYRESLHMFLLVIGCAIGAMSAIIDSCGFPGATVFALFTGFAVPLAMGVLAFEADVDHNQLRFLVSRGVSPGSVWLTKHAVWLPRAFWIAAVIFIVSLVCERLMVSRSLSNQDFSLQLFFKDAAFQWHFAIWYVLLSYSCGQLSSFLFQRAVLAGVFGIIFNFVAVAWLIMVVNSRVPLSWSVGFPIIAMLLFTLWQMKPRMLEEHSWSNRWKMIIALSGVPAIVMLGIIYGGYRVFTRGNF